MKPLTEFVGTFLFLFVVALAAPTGAPLAPLAIGGALMVAVYAGGHRSGAHYNPAVSLALFLQRKLSAKDLLAYWVAQFLAGIAAFFAGYEIVGKQVYIGPRNGHSNAAAFAVEAVFTFMLALVVMNTAATPETKGNSFYGLAIGFAVVVAAVAGGGVSGGAFNPALAVGATLVGSRHGNGFTHLWLPVSASCLGAAVASYFWAYQEANDKAPPDVPTDLARS